MNILLSIIGLLLILILVILLYPVKYALIWHHEGDEKHQFEFRLVLFSGLFGVRAMLTGIEKSFQLILFGQSRKTRKIHFKGKKTEPEQPEKPRKTAPARIKKVRNLLRNFTKQEVMHLFRITFRHVWRWLRPHSYNLKMTYGFDNPATTGYVYGFLWASGIIKFEHVDIETNYLQPELTGYANIYGNLIIGGIFLRTLVVALVIGKILLRKKLQLSPAFSTFSQ